MMTTKQPQRQATAQSDANKKPVQRSSQRGSNNRSHNNNNGNIDLLNDEEFQNNSQDRLLFLIFHSIGSRVKALTNSGTTIIGVLENIDPKTLQLFLNIENDTGLTSINYDDLINFEIQDVDLFNVVTPKESGSSNGIGKGFKTDVDISNQQSTQRRSEIEKWVPEDNKVAAFSLEDSDNSTTKNWDQFQVNEEKFGVVSEFDENLYTTKLNKDDPEYLKKREKANILALEIEKSSYNGSIHIAEERGLKFDDSGIDEEDKYSGVDRSSSTLPGFSSKSDALFNSLINKEKKDFVYKEDPKSTKYVPPSQRSRLQNIDDSIISATPISQESSAPSAPQAVVSGASSTSDETLDVKKSKVESETIKSLSKSTTPSTTTVLTKVTSSTTLKVSTPSTIPPKPSLPPKPTGHTDKKHPKNSVSSRDELNSLKEFSQNFKIPRKFPEDLLPIITKDKQKQEEIIKKNEEINNVKPVASPVLSNTTTPSSSATPAASISSNTSTAVATTSTPSVIKTSDTVKAKSPIKENADLPVKKEVKSNFKLNPKAASFTPSFTPSSTSSVGSPISNVSNISSSSPVFQRNSPRLSNPIKNRRNNYVISPNSFFPLSKLPNAEKPRSFGDDYNFFKGCLNDFKKKQELKAQQGTEGASEVKQEEKFFLERPFTTPPTWSTPNDDFTKPYKSLFPDIKFHQQHPLQLPQIPLQQQPQLPLQPHQQPQLHYPGMQQRFISTMHHPQTGVVYQNPMQQFQPIPIIQGGQQQQQPQPGSQGNGNPQGGGGGGYYPPGAPANFVPLQVSPQINNPAIHSDRQSPQFYQQRLQPGAGVVPPIYNGQRYLNPNQGGFIPQFNGVPPPLPHGRLQSGYGKNH